MKLFIAIEILDLGFLFINVSDVLRLQVLLQMPIQDIVVEESEENECDTEERGITTDCSNALPD